MSEDEKEARRLVLDFFQGNQEKADLWFLTNNPLLGNISPALLIFMGKSDRLLKIIKDQLQENEL